MWTATRGPGRPSCSYTTVQCSAINEAGNEGNDTFDVTVWDTTAPVLTVGGSVTVTATSNSGAGAVSAGDRF